MAAKSVTVGQVDQLLYALRGKSDAKVAGELSDLELTERVSAPRLAHWEADSPGSRTREALIKLADLAAFLNPPAAEVDPVPAPDSGTQDRMLELAAEYVKTTIARLPNFLATRETTHFEDTPSQQGLLAIRANPLRSHGAPSASDITMSGSEYKSLHSTGSSSATVTYRDGSEVHGGEAPSKNEVRPSTGLTTNGEFGPILSVVIGDVLRSGAAWQRWEQGAGDPVAVFRYTVSAEQSNYLVKIPVGEKLDSLYPSYHGEIAIDPATGAILRISVMAELPPPYQAMQSAIVVEYAPVTIGEQSYICPVHGVAFSRVPLAHGAAAQDSATVNVQTQLNDVIFTGYHVFRSETRILNAASGTDGTNASPQAPAPADSTGAAPAEQHPK